MTSAVCMEEPLRCLVSVLNTGSRDRFRLLHDGHACIAEHYVVTAPTLKKTFGLSHVDALRVPFLNTLSNGSIRVNSGVL